MDSMQVHGYDEWLLSLKKRIRDTQTKAILSVNSELIKLYWGIGRDILERQAKFGWGSKVVDQMAADLKKEFPEISGFSSRNVKYMTAYPL